MKTAKEVCKEIEVNKLVKDAQILEEIVNRVIAGEGSYTFTPGYDYGYLVKVDINAIRKNKSQLENLGYKINEIVKIVDIGVFFSKFEEIFIGIKVSACCGDEK